MTTQHSGVIIPINIVDRMSAQVPW